jgi:predicted transcriptional regulator
VLKPFATKLDEEVIAKLDTLAQKTQIPKSRLCRQAIELLAAHYERLEEDLQIAEQIRRGEPLTPAPLSQ